MCCTTWKIVANFPTRPSNAYFEYTLSTDTITIVPAAVVDANTNSVLPSGTPITSFSEWTMSLLAETSGTSVSSYSWNFSSAADAGSITGYTTNNVHFTWGSFGGPPAHTDTINLTETTTGGKQFTQSYTFTQTVITPRQLNTMPANPPLPPRPAIITPDQLARQPLRPGPTPALAWSMVLSRPLHRPVANPNASPLSLVYTRCLPIHNLALFTVMPLVPASLPRRLQRSRLSPA